MPTWSINIGKDLAAGPITFKVDNTWNLKITNDICFNVTTKDDANPNETATVVGGSTKTYMFTSMKMETCTCCGSYDPTLVCPGFEEDGFDIDAGTPPPPPNTVVVITSSGVGTGIESGGGQEYDDSDSDE